MSTSSYGASLRPTRPGRLPQRSPVIKLGATESDQQVPGPGSYSPRHVGKPSVSAWTMGDRNARNAVVRTGAESPGPIYQMKSSVNPQAVSTRQSSPRYRFGTEKRLTHGRHVGTPGPGAYTPRVTCGAERSAMSNRTDLVDGASSARSTPNGTWARTANRSLAEAREGPGPMTYRPEKSYIKANPTAYSIRQLGDRGGIHIPGSQDSPGPSAYHPHLKSRKGGGQIGDAPAFTFADKDDAAPKFISKQHARIYQGKHSPSPSAYTPLEGQQGYPSVPQHTHQRKHT